MESRKTFFLVITLLLGLLLLFITRDFIVVIISSFFVGYLVRPFYRLVNKLIPNKSISALTAEFFFFFVVIASLFFVFSTIYTQLRSLSSSFLSEAFLDVNNTFLNLTLNYLSSNNPFTEETVSNIFSAAQSLILQTPILLLDTFLLIFISFYFIKDYSSIGDTVIKMIPSQNRYAIKHFFRRAGMMTGEVVYGYFLTALFIGLLLFVLLTMLDVKYSLDYAVFGALFSLFPIFGSWVVPIFLAVSYFIQSNYLASILLVIFAVFSSYFAKLFGFIIGRSSGNIHPLLFIVGVFVGFYSLGFLGFLTGPIIFGVLQIGLEELFKPK